MSDPRFTLDQTCNIGINIKWSPSFKSAQLLNALCVTLRLILILLVWDNDMVIQFDALDRKLCRIVMRSGSRGRARPGQCPGPDTVMMTWHRDHPGSGAGRDHLIIKLLTVTTTIKTDSALARRGNIWWQTGRQEAQCQTSWREIRV